MSQTATATSARNILLKNFQAFQIANLKGISRSDFEHGIRSRIGRIDAAAEGYAESEIRQQRDLSIKFHWGHNHDFGDFQIAGRMGDRHIDLMCDFAEKFAFDLDSFTGKSVLDVGCWTGGTTLLLASLADQVAAIEEVNKYAETTEFLAESFGLGHRVSCHSRSIYDCNDDGFFEQFDVVYFPGVVYHLSDPVLALRILFNSLKLGGCILVESAGLNEDEPICRFEGNSVVVSGNRADLNRSGWNWFLPSPSALGRMMREAGFREVQSHWCPRRNRVFAFGSKTEPTGICKAGLSVPGIR